MLHQIGFTSPLAPGPGRSTCPRLRQTERACDPTEQLAMSTMPRDWNIGYFGEQAPRKRYAQTIDQWIVHAAASVAHSRSEPTSSRASSATRPASPMLSSAGSRSSVDSASSLVQASDDVAVRALASSPCCLTAANRFRNRVPGAC